MRVAAARQRVEIAEAEADLDRLAETLRREGAEVEAHAYGGSAGYVILEQAKAQGADLIAMCTHGRSGAARFVLGSVADEVLRHAEVPLFLVPRGCRPWQNGVSRVLVPLDGSPLAEEVIEPTLRLADAFHAELLLARVMEHSDDDREKAMAYLDKVASGFPQRGRHVRTQLLSGSPAAALAETARDEAVDLIAMATHGRGGVARLLLGSVATTTLLRATTPVLVVRPGALREELPPIERTVERKT
jgi:nucleotide-binding universal stress UspA family protein